MKKDVSVMAAIIPILISGSAYWQTQNEPLAAFGFAALACILALVREYRKVDRDSSDD